MTKVGYQYLEAMVFIMFDSGPERIALPECLTPTMKHPISVTIWGCMSESGIGRIEVVNGTPNATQYIHEFLEPKVLPSV